MLKKAKVIMLPTDKKSNYCVAVDSENHRANVVYNNCEHEDYNYFHLYIVDDSPIKKSDWRLDIFMNNPKPILCDEDCENSFSKRIIATTDLSIRIKVYDYSKQKEYNPIKETWKGKSNYKHIHLPSPSPAFIQKYVDLYNAGNSITDVLVEYEGYKANGMIDETTSYRIKVDKNNYITIKRIKNNYSREEVEKIIRLAMQSKGYTPEYEIIQFVNENL